MALTTSRLLVLTASACAAIAASYLPPHGDDPWGQWRSTQSAERDFARGMGDNVYNTRRALTTLQFRDSVLSHARPLVPGIDVYVDDAVPEELGTAVRTLLEDSAGVIASTSAVPLIIGVLLDTMVVRDGVRSIPPRRGPRTHYFLPDSTRGSCVVVTAIGGDIRGNILDRQEGETFRSPYGLRELVGPCELYARFGSPSESMDRWLANGGVGDAEPLLARCRAHEQTACEAVLDRDTRGVVSPYGPDVFSLRGGEGGGLAPRFNRRDQGFFERMEKDFGRRVVQLLWVENAPLPEAFERTTGENLTDWFSGTLQPTDGRGFRPEVALSPSQVLGAIVFCLVAFGVSSVARMHRRLGLRREANQHQS